MIQRSFARNNDAAYLSKAHAVISMYGVNTQEFSCLHLGINQYFVGVWRGFGCLGNSFVEIFEVVSIAD
jgi:hypothetical protein